MNRLVMADVPEMQPHRLLNIDLRQRSAQRARQPAGVLIGPVRGAEAGHGYAPNVFPGNAQQIEGAGRHKKGKRGIQATGNPDHRAAAFRMLQPLFQAVGLNGKDFLAAAVLHSLIRRDEGLCGEKSLQGKLLFFHMHRDDQIALLFRRGEGVHPASFMAQPVDVQIRINGLVFKPFCLRKQHAVFRDQVMPAEDQILGGFPVSRAGIYISCHKPCAGGLHQLSAVGVLSHRLIGGGQIDDHRGPGQAVCGGRGLRRPQVLADLTSHRQPLYAVTGKEDLPPEGNRIPLKGKEIHLIRSRHEMTGFIKLRVTRQSRFGNEGEHPSVLKGSRHVIQLPVLLQGKPHKDQSVRPFRMRRDLPKRLLCS